MKTTMLIVEFLVGGILVLLALTFLIGSVFRGDILAIPRALVQILSDPNQCQPQSTGILLLLSTIFVAIAYAVGILLAPVAREMFEWMLRSVRKGRLQEYFDWLDKDGIDRTKISFLKDLEVNQDQVPTGIMRFYVLMKSQELYQDIASQLHRYRLMRLSFFAETILILAVVIQLLQENPPTSMWVLALIAVILVFVFPPIYDHIERYCKVIGKPKNTKEKSSNTKEKSSNTKEKSSNTKEKSSNTKEKSSKMKIKAIRLGFFALYVLVVVSMQLLQEDSSPLVSALVILILIAALNVVIIRDRFERYCRAIERSLTALFLAEKGKRVQKVVKTKMLELNSTSRFP